jgi:hypothetical protein
MSLSRCYRICDLVLTSNIDLPELASVEGDDWDCQFKLISSDRAPVDEIDWFHQWMFNTDGDDEDSKIPWVNLGRTPAGYLLRFPSYGDFFLSADAKKIECHPLPATSRATLRHLLLDQVIPLALSRRAQIVLHASAVLTQQGVIAFAGKSGDGKSTMAGCFARAGFPVLADDFLVLRRDRAKWMAIPSYPSLRLWPDAIDALLPAAVQTGEVADYSTKRRVGNTERNLLYASSPAPLRRLYVFASDAGKVWVERLPSAQAMIKLVEFSYNLDIKDVVFLRKQFNTVARLTRDVAVYAIHHPREFTALPTLREAILRHTKEEIGL